MYIFGEERGGFQVHNNNNIIITVLFNKRRQIFLFFLNLKLLKGASYLALFNTNVGI